MPDINLSQAEETIKARGSIIKLVNLCFKTLSMKEDKVISTMICDMAMESIIDSVMKIKKAMDKQND